MNYTEAVHTGLALSPPEPDHWHLGSGKASARFGGAPLNPSGDWTASKMPDEPQSRPNFDTQGCADFATLKAWMMLARFLGFTDFMPDASERYTGAWAGTGPRGTNPHVVAEVTRTKAGMLPGVLMPWTDESTFESYYDKKVAEHNLPMGSALLARYSFGHEWVIPFGSSYTPEEKQRRLQEALTRGPVCVSVSGWYRYKNGKLTKNVGEADTHWVVLLKHDGKNGTIHDQYGPEFVKMLDDEYDHQAAKVYFLSRKQQTTRTFWSWMWDLFALNVWKGS